MSLMNTAQKIQFDKLATDVCQLKQNNTLLTKRVSELESTILKILDTFKRSETTFELRVSRVLHQVLHGVTHELEHGIENAVRSLTVEEQGFDIYPVDNITVLENDKTILVTLKDDGYDFSLAVDPTTIMNEGTEPFVEWFKRNPAVMGNATQIKVNIVTYQQDNNNG